VDRSSLSATPVHCRLSATGPLVKCRKGELTDAVWRVRDKCSRANFSGKKKRGMERSPGRDWSAGHSVLGVARIEVIVVPVLNY
jgi:hypothetical protein